MDERLKRIGLRSLEVHEALYIGAARNLSAEDTMILAIEMLVESLERTKLAWMDDLDTRVVPRPMVIRHG